MGGALELCHYSLSFSFKFVVSSFLGGWIFWFTNKIYVEFNGRRFKSEFLAET